jgi:hypothetical protein
MMPRGNPSKLIPNSQRTPEELREITRKGGIRSGQVRREKKLLSTIYGEFLAKEFNINIDGQKKKISGALFVQSVMTDILKRKDSASVSLMKEIREATEGSKVDLNAMVETVNITDELSFEQRKELAAEWLKNQKSN